MRCQASSDLNQIMRSARSFRRQRQVRPALLRDLLFSYPANYTRRMPTPTSLRCSRTLLLLWMERSASDTRPFSLSSSPTASFCLSFPSVILKEWYLIFLNALLVCHFVIAAVGAQWITISRVPTPHGARICLVTTYIHCIPYLEDWSGLRTVL